MVDSAFQVMNFLEIPIWLQSDIQEFFLLTIKTRENQKLFDVFLSEIPPSLQAKAQRKIFEDNLRNNPVIMNLIDKEANIKDIQKLLAQSTIIQRTPDSTPQKKASLTLFENILYPA